MFNPQEFQTVEEWRAGLATFLASDAGIATMRVLRSMGWGYDVKLDADPMHSVRTLSYYGGWNRALDVLEAMSRPPAPPPQDPGEPTFGVAGDGDDHVASQYDPEKDAALQRRRAEQMEAFDKPKEVQEHA